MIVDNLHPVLAAQVQTSRGVSVISDEPFDIEMDGTALVWLRDGWMLSWRGERQALPSGSSPLQVNGGHPISGQGWTAAEVQRFGEVTGAAVVFERPL